MEPGAEKEATEDPVGNLITLAHDEFNSGDFQKCLQLLDKLEISSGTNVKLQHNRAVVEFYRSDCKDHESLMKALGDLEEPENSKSTNSLVVGTVHYTMNPIARYNRAVIYYHRRCYRTAIDLLTPLLDKGEAMDETASLIALLMLRLLLATNQLNKALAFLEYLLKRLGISTQETALPEETVLPPHLATLPEFSRTFKQLLLLTKVVNRRAVLIPDDGTPQFATLKAHQYYIMKDFQMAAKQLKKISEQGNTGNKELDTCIANNMGVIHLRVRHYALAAKFFQMAITFDRQVASNLQSLPLQKLSTAHSCEILYNLGIAMLHLRRPQEAFQCFLVPLKGYHSNPRLWFRMAEACIMHHEMKMLEQEKAPIISSPTQRAQAMKAALRTPYASSTQSAAVPEPNLEFASLSLRNALTLTNYYKSVYYTPPAESEASGGATESEESNWKHVKDNNFCHPSIPITKEALDNMLSAIYAAYSYVSLRLGDYVTALEMAQELLKTEKISDAHKLLAHMYAGEALLMMDKLTEAKPHLDPSFVSTLNAFDFETKDWQVKSLDAAQNIVRYNLAVAMSMQGDFDSAISLLNTCTHEIVAKKIKAFRRYMSIKSGKCT